MKLRIKNNSVRIRLTQTEVDSFGRDGIYSSTTLFGADSTLRYSIVRADKDLLSLRFQNNHLEVLIPGTKADEWANTDLVGMEGEQENGTEKPTTILVEKDFKCLIPRPDEDESSHYPNPAAPGD